MLFDLTRLKTKRSSILCRVATDAMYCRRFCAVIKIKARSTNMNPRHGIFVLNYFFIEYSLASFLKCHAAYRDFFSVFFTFTPYRIAFAPPRESYRMQLLFTHKNGCGGAISVTERSCAARCRSRKWSRLSSRLFVGTYRNQAVYT